MTTSINSEITPPKTAKPVPPKGPVTIAHADALDGRLPVTITVVPIADLDAKGGVFVDFRMGSKGPDNGEKAPGLTALPGGGTKIQQGDSAIAALAANEDAAAAPAPALAANEEAAAAPAPAGTKRPLVSHQIAQPIKLTVGQAETFRADVAVPAVSADAGQAWYMRGRFATLGGKDLNSGWVRV